MSSAKKNPQKMKVYASFNDWQQDQSAKNQKLIDALQHIIEKTAPHLTTGVKWGQGCWLDGSTPKVYIHTEEDFVQLGFYNGASLHDTHQLLEGSGKYIRYIKVHTTDDIDQDAFASLIEQAIY